VLHRAGLGSKSKLRMVVWVEEGRVASWGAGGRGDGGVVVVVGEVMVGRCWVRASSCGGCLLAG